MTNYAMNEKLGGDPLPETVEIMEVLKKHFPDKVNKLNKWVRKDLTAVEYITAFFHDWSLDRAVNEAAAYSENTDVQV